MRLANEKIREAARHADIPLWQVAHAMNISEATLFRWLRVPLAPEVEKKVFDTIAKIQSGVS